MISATEVPEILRVSFPLNVGADRQCEIVCLVRAEEQGIGIYYSHHQWRRRVTPSGPWEDESAVRLAMTPALETQILVGVPNELWSAFARAVRVAPGALGQSVSELKFELAPRR